MKRIALGILLVLVSGCGRKNVETPFVAQKENDDFTEEMLKTGQPREVVPGSTAKGDTTGGTDGGGAGTPVKNPLCYWVESGYESLPGGILKSYQDADKNHVADGGGCVSQNISRVMDVLRNGDTLQWDESEFDGDPKIISVGSPFTFGILVGHKNNPFPLIIVRWRIEWKHMLRNEPKLPGVQEVQFQKVFGEETLEYWGGRILLTPLNENTTAFNMRNSIRGKAGTAAAGKIDAHKSNRAVLRILENVRKAVGH